jgi:S-adenosylmethionine hydrolase
LTARRPVITLLTDYGLRDPFVGICHGVIASICPQAQIIDLTHGIARHDVDAGAFVLARALRYLPAGVHFAVVDPGVGGERRALVLALADGRLLVGPDNGLLWPAGQQGGGVLEAVEISQSPFRLEPISATFHGRDLFAPIAAHLAAGTALADVGEPVPIESLVTLGPPPVRVEGGQLIARVAYIDGFGNAALGAATDDLAALGLVSASPASPNTFRPTATSARVSLAGGNAVDANWARTFDSTPAGEVMLYEDSFGVLAIAVSQGSAAERLGLRTGDVVRITFEPAPHDG